MKFIDLDTANQVYQYGATCSQEDALVDHTDFQMFWHLALHLEHELKDDQDENSWQDLRSRLRRYRFDLCAAPIPLSSGTQELASFLKRQMDIGRISYPQQVPLLERLYELLEKLAQIERNPLYDALQKIADIRDLRQGAMLLNASRLAPVVASVLAQSPRLSQLGIIAEHELRAPECYNILIVIGPRHWFSDFVFSAPHASAMISVRYRWLQDRWTPHPIFRGSLIPSKQYTVKLILDQGEQAIPTLSPTDIELERDENWKADLDDLVWPAYADRLISRSSRHEADEHDTETVKAQLLLLSGGNMVLLEIADDVKTLVLDVDADEVDDGDDLDRVQGEDRPAHFVRLTTDKIRPGMFLLLRTSGSGDYIVPIADRLLGSSAQHLRAMQEAWKSALHAQVRADGLFKVSVDLLYLGSERANEINVRNWMSSRNIRPRDYKDFLAIMRLIGFEQQAEDYWQAAEKIDRAHRKAGHQLRDLLLRQVQEVDLRTLQHKGRMDFQISAMEGGSLTAFRVERLLPDPIWVLASRLGRPFTEEEH